MSLWRPCDAVESAVAWKSAIERSDGPTCLVFTRQSVPHQARTPEQIDDISRGGYVLSDCEGTPEAILIATGSEVGLAMDAAQELTRKGRRVRVVSMASTDVFDAQDEAYRHKVLPPKVTARVAIEAGVPDYWLKYVGLNGEAMGINSFGESAPAKEVYKHFGLTVERVVETVETVI